MKVPLQQQHHGTLANTLKKPQGAATFWGDAIVFFHPSISNFQKVKVALWRTLL
jgi:hypothetical protein